MNNQEQGILKNIKSSTREGVQNLPFSLREVQFAFVCGMYAVSVYLAGALYLENDPMAIAMYKGGKLSHLDMLLIACLFVFINPFRSAKFVNISSLFVHITYFLLLVPVVAVTMARVDMTFDQKLLLILVSIVSYIIISYGQNNSKPLVTLVSFSLRKLIVPLMLLWILFAALLFYKYHSIMKIVGLDDIYSQRFAGRANDLFWGYIQVYFIYFISASLMSIGLHTKNIPLFAMGALGCLLQFMITAERSTILMPFAIMLVAKIYKKREAVYRNITVITLVATLSILAIIKYSSESELIAQIGFYFLSRIILTPGQFMGDYFLYFDDLGFTYYTHIRWFAYFIDPPNVLSTHYYWPNLGWMVGNNFHGIDSNSNASFWASDGIASLGLSGVIIISVLVRIYLTVLNSTSGGEALPIIIPAMFPLFFSLTNGSFFSMILSYGGGLWVILLIYCNAKKFSPCAPLLCRNLLKDA